MISKYSTVLLVCVMILIACKDSSRKDVAISKEDLWHLQWGMVYARATKDYKLGIAQFDSLLTTGNMKNKFFLEGIKLLVEAGQTNRVKSILAQQNASRLDFLCNTDFFRTELDGLSVCSDYSKKEDVKFLELREELIKMYINDQFFRGAKDLTILKKYDLDLDSVLYKGVAVRNVDLTNMKKLKQILNRYGTVTKSMVGEDAMEAVFYVIQHAPDSEWQANQLPLIKKLCENGDMSMSNYAYLYDRIQMLQNKPQLFGTQIVKVDLDNKQVVLWDVADVQHLDERRLAYELMPIEMYKLLLLEHY